jgi:transposase
VEIGCREAADRTADVGARRERSAGGQGGVNANQVFKWRRAFERGELSEPGAASTGLLPVTVSAACETTVWAAGGHERPTTSASIHIELPGRAMICVDRGADPVLLRLILESLHK